MAQCFELVGPGVELIKGRNAIKKTKSCMGFGLAAPVLRKGKASVTFEIDFAAEEYGFSLGLFPANLKLGSSIGSDDGKRAALLVASGRGGSAQILCDGEQSERLDNLGWKPGDTVQVEVAFEGDTAVVTFHLKDLSEQRTIRGVPACGLCFGAGMVEAKTAVALVQSSAFEQVLLAREAPHPSLSPRSSAHDIVPLCGCRKSPPMRRRSSSARRSRFRTLSCDPCGSHG